MARQVKKKTPRVHVKHLSPKKFAKMMEDEDDRRKEVEKPKTIKQFVSDQQRKFKRTNRELQNIAPGGVHTMTSGSVAAIIEATGVLAFSGRCVLVVGCGVGNMCNHFIQLGAKFVVGTDFADVLKHVPPIFIKENHNVRFKAADFLKMESIEQNISIICMIIGIPKLVSHLFKLFLASTHVKRIIFMIPVCPDQVGPDNRHNMFCDINELFPEDKFVISEKIEIKNAKETTRYCLTIHRRVYRQKKKRDTASSCIV